MFRRAVDIAKAVIGVDPEARQVESFRLMMVELLKNPPAGGINTGDLRVKAGLSEQGASRVVSELYLRFARKVASDGVITGAERAKLDGLAAILELSEPKAKSIEQIAFSEVYEEAARQAMADGVVTLDEAAHLADLRRNLLPDPEDIDSEIQAGLSVMFDRAAFREALVRDFKRLDPRTFSLESYADEAGAPLSVAAEVAEELYARFADKVFADGIVTPTERAHLDILTKAFRIDPSWAASVEDRSRREVYRKAVLDSLADGIISPDEASRLEILRRNLGISASHAAHSAGGLAGEAYEALIRRIAESGVADDDSMREVERFKRGLGLSDADAARIIRPRAIGLYREIFTEILQDGEVGRPQEELLAWLQSETGLGPEDIAPFAERLGEAKRLSEYRSGRLPSVDTRRLLEGGEICHWDSPCRHSYQTAKGVVIVEGELIATSKRVIFVSPTRNFSFAPWKIVDIEGLAHRVTIKAEVRQGTGDYWVARPKDLEAILVGLAKKGKYTASSVTGSEMTRHISGEVKRAVWARDGGRCVQCQDNRYLEFDHIIPHSQGGANSFANVQLLCRKCNGEKSDRI